MLDKRRSAVRPSNRSQPVDSFSPQNALRPKAALKAIILRTGSVIFSLLAFFISMHSERPATLTVTVRDAVTGLPTPVRVHLSNANGTIPRLPDDLLAIPGTASGIPEAAIAIMYGRQDRAEGFALQPDGSFYVDGRFEMHLPAGTYYVKLSKGYEFVKQQHTLEIGPGEHVVRTFDLRRWINMAARGWYSADDHIHLRRSPREDPLILRWIAAEDINVGHLLQMGDFWRDSYFTQYNWGEHGRYREGNHILSSGQEDPRTPEIGHTISLAASELVRFPDQYYYYDRVFDRVHALGGITGYAHWGFSWHAYRGMMLDVIRNKVDFLELLQFCRGGPLFLDHYYHFLDLGYKLTAAAGSDFPFCSRGPIFGSKENGGIGDARFYTYVGNTFSFDRWLASVKYGHTFVTSGPILEFTVEGRLPGDVLNLQPNSNVRVSAIAYGHPSQIPLEKLEIVGHGTILKSVSFGDSGQDRGRLSIEMELPVKHGIWLAARCTAGVAQVAHTTPVYVTINGGTFHNPETSGYRLRESETYLQEIEKLLRQPSSDLDFQLARYREGISARIAEVRRLLAEISEHGSVDLPANP